MCMPSFAEQLALLTSVLLLMVAATGCQDSAPPANYVARVGDSYLTSPELEKTLQDLSTGKDSVEARQQIIEQWVTNELLYQEAQNRGLRENTEVQRLLKENERSVLISALVSSLYEQNQVQPSADEVRSYYNQHRQQLTLREPFAQVRHLATRSLDSAAAARQQLQQAVIAGHADSVWTQLVLRYAQDPNQSRDLSKHFYPESRYFRSSPSLQAALQRLSDGQIAPLVRTDSLVHVLQLVKRVPAGSVPQLDWIRDQIRQRLRVKARKEVYARQLQNLRNEALAGGQLDVPE